MLTGRLSVMDVKHRIELIRLLEKMEENREFCKEIGLSGNMSRVDSVKGLPPPLADSKTVDK